MVFDMAVDLPADGLPLPPRHMPQHGKHRICVFLPGHGRLLSRKTCRLLSKVQSRAGPEHCIHCPRIRPPGLCL